MALERTDERGWRHVQKTLTIRKSAEDLYAVWRNFEVLPQFMKHVETVTVQDRIRSHWVVTAPAGQTVEWDAEIHAEQPNQLIAWRSLPPAPVQHEGEVRFRPAPQDRGTEVSVVLQYDPPVGALGAKAAKLFGEEPSQQLDEDLYRFKQLMETGRIPTADGQPHGER